KPKFAVAEAPDERGTPRQNAKLTVVHRQGHEIGRLIEHCPFRRNHNALQGPKRGFHRRQFPSPAIFLAFSAASSMPPTYINALSGRWSHLPSHNSLKL